MATDRPVPADEAAGSADGPASPPEAPPRSQPDKPPAEPRSRAELYADLRAADQPPGAGRPTDDAHTTPDGGWSWKGLRLDPAANHVADQQLAARRAAEGRHPDGNYDDHGLTPALRRVEAQLDHGTLIPDTEKFALKSPDRFKEKLAKMIERRPDATVSELAEEIHDGIRYTFIFDPAQYTDQTQRACSSLTGDGYELIRRANRWGGEEYKGVNTRWSDPHSGQSFEIQFHTPASWEAKQLTHESYEKIENPETPVGQVEALRTYQRAITSSLEIPGRWEEIRDYRKPGH
ncbi:MAG TPA: hypothetical protein VN847_04345 [Streptosporangiaceae bacterium]|nr:hypothetical protein [Streptosporangiaceae bacterium]